MPSDTDLFQESLSIHVDETGLTYRAGTQRLLGDAVVARSRVLAQVVETQASHLHLPCSQEAFEHWLNFDRTFAALQQQPDAGTAASLFMVCFQASPLTSLLA